MPDKLRDIKHYQVTLPKEDVELETLWKLWAYFTFKDAKVSTQQYLEMRKAFKLGGFECMKYLQCIIKEGCSIADVVDVINKLVDEGHAYLEDLR